MLIFIYLFFKGILGDYFHYVILLILILLLLCYTKPFEVSASLGNEKCFDLVLFIIVLLLSSLVHIFLALAFTKALHSAFPMSYALIEMSYI